MDEEKRALKQTYTLTHIHTYMHTYTHTHTHTHRMDEEERACIHTHIHTHTHTHTYRMDEEERALIQKSLDQHARDIARIDTNKADAQLMIRELAEKASRDALDDKVDIILT